MTQTDLSEPLILIDKEEFIAWSTVKHVNFATNRIYFLGSGDRGILFTDEITKEILIDMGWPAIIRTDIYANPAAISHVSPAKGNTNVVRVDFKDGSNLLDQSLQITPELYVAIVQKWRDFLSKQLSA